MPMNIEIKARASDFARQSRLAEEIAGPQRELLRQTDTFFPRRRGRLKLRETVGRPPELIFYRRGDVREAKPSRYRVMRPPDSAALSRRLGERLGVLGVVRKERRLHLAGRTRIHLDRVAGLGDYIELEVMLAPGEDEAAGRREAAALMARLEIRAADLRSGAYLDLLASRETDP